jgi:hypothetical protein
MMQVNIQTGTAVLFKLQNIFTPKSATGQNMQGLSSLISDGSCIWGVTLLICVESSQRSLSKSGASNTEKVVEVLMIVNPCAYLF